MFRNPVTPFALLLVIITGSCYTSQLSMDVLEPAKTELPSGIQRISILPMPGAPSLTGKFDSLALLWSQETNIYQVKMGYLHGLYDILTNSPRLLRVVLSDTLGNTYIKSGHLYWDDLRQVCARDTTNMVLVLTRVICRENYPSGINYVDEESYNLLDYTLINNTRWVFYEPSKEQIAVKYDFSDTLRINGDFVLLELPDLLYEACYMVGQRTGKKLVPYWTTVSRVLYNGPGKDMRDAAKFAYDNHWFKAALLWNGLVDHRNKKIASRAAFNLALAFERDDDLKQSLLWINYADSLLTNTNTIAYSKILAERIKANEKLDAQMTAQ